VIHVLYIFLFNEVRVELSLAEGKDRGPAIVEAARKQGVSLLVVGQKKRSVTWRLLSMWMAGMKGAATAASTGAADYCVQNAACMALAVRRKSRRGGGYLITTRRQRDFWLLA
jgi:nucleotide-binding universal stress UspA family protein